jgi:uncharacterized protein
MTRNGPDPVDVLAAAKRIAVVGMSSDPEKPSHRIPGELIKRNFRVIPVNPAESRILGQPAYDSLADIPEEFDVDIVNVFRPAGEAPEIVRAAIDRGVRTVWLQEGIVSHEAREIARDAGLAYLEDTCIGTTAQLHDVQAERTIR